jgi:hypothetical protein
MPGCGPTGVTSDPTWPRLNTSAPQPVGAGTATTSPRWPGSAHPRPRERASTFPEDEKPLPPSPAGHSRDETGLGTVPRNHPDLVTRLHHHRRAPHPPGPSPARPFTRPALHPPDPSPARPPPATATPTPSRGGSGLSSGRGADVRCCRSPHCRAPERRLSRERPLRLSGSPRPGRPGRARCPRRLG